MRKKLLLTPYLDEVEERKKMFMPDLYNPSMPAPSPLDVVYMEIAEKHGIDLMEEDFSDYGNSNSMDYDDYEE